MTKWDLRYLNLAKQVSEWSKDPSSKIGAVAIGDKGQVLAQGYNGFPRGIDDSDDRYNDRPTKYKYIVDAEMSNGSADLSVAYQATVVAGTTDTQNLTLSNQTAGKFTAAEVIWLLPSFH